MYISSFSFLDHLIAFTFSLYDVFSPGQIVFYSLLFLQNQVPVSLGKCSAKNGEISHRG